MVKTRIEPVLWLLFSGGGLVAALMVPVLLFLFGVAIPLGWVAPPDHAHLLAVVRHPLTRLALLGLCVLALFHWAHRFKYTLYDGLQLKRLHRPINAFCYGGAVFGSAVAGYLLLFFV
jgi:succinate dehydrogenase subunit D